MKAIRIGTAGWPIPASSRHLFDDHGSLLERYAARFNAVEINSSFYRPHRRTTYERWAGSVPEDFLFSAKLPKAITHQKALKDCDTDVVRFAEDVTGLGQKLGAVLVQLPPRLRFDASDARAVFEDLRKTLSAAIVCEPRHGSWFTRDAEALMLEFDVSRAAADPAPVAAAAEPAGSMTSVYLRLHGSPRMYHSNYDGDALGIIKARLLDHAARGAKAWCIFDNTAEFAATANALSLIDMIKEA